MSPSTDGKTGGRQSTSAESGANGATGRIDDETVFDILKNSRRRATLEYLIEAGDDPVPVSVIAEQVAAAENETTPEDLSPEERKRVYVSLHQCHLPKMHDLRVLRYDQEETAVELGPNAPRVSTYMRATSGESRQWYRYYGAIAAGGAGLLVANETVLGWSPLIVAGLVLSAVVLCSIADWWTLRDDDGDALAEGGLV
jgi:hypothetical protein